MKKNLSFLMGLLFLSVVSFSQEQVNEKMAKKAVYLIVQHAGLTPNFVVRENPEVKTAVAFIKNKKRYIEYNPVIVSGIVDSSQTNWSAVSILAHEIGHHLLGHTLNPNTIGPGDEMACDRFSGFILQSMGASLEESLVAMELAGNPHGSKIHPPKSARLAAIKQGWDDSRDLKDANFDPDWNLEVEHFLFKIHFEGDENNYYVNEDQTIVWFDNYAEPIEFGTFEESDDDNFIYKISWEQHAYYVDGNRVIWQMMPYNASMKVGTIEVIEAETDEENQSN